MPKSGPNLLSNKWPKLSKSTKTRKSSSAKFKSKSKNTRKIYCNSKSKKLINKLKNTVRFACKNINNEKIIFKRLNSEIKIDKKG